MRGRLVVLGESGQVAQDLPEVARRHGFTEIVSIGRAKVDLSLADAGRLLDELRPDAVVNAAAYTAVDKAEDDREAAFALNAVMPGRFAQASAARLIPFVQISTDYVFDGSKPSPYVETDPCKPLGVYGQSKRDGELRVQEAGGSSAILRTAWVYGPHGANFMKTMIRLAQTRDELGVVDDQIGSPTTSADVAEGAVRTACALLDQGIEGGRVFHCAGEGQASWADFAAAIFEEEAGLGRPAPAIRRITTADFPTPASRPANSRLDSSLLESVVGWRPQPWRSALTNIYRTLENRS